MKGPFGDIASPAAAAAPASSVRRESRAARTSSRIDAPFDLLVIALPPQALKRLWARQLIQHNCQKMQQGAKNNSGWLHSSRPQGRIRVLAEERQSLILNMVNQRGSLSITEIQRKLRVSRETVRRDLMLLADRQALRKTHGGALSLERSEPEIAVREVTNAEGKRAIGRLAVSLVPDGASIILSSGSTVQSVADALQTRQGLTIFTNSVFNCMRLMGRNKNRVVLLGGEVQSLNGCAL